jgi:CheY-like chemotaxis protein
VAEDEPSLRKLTCNTLKEAGYKVLEAEGASKAIEIAKHSDSDIDLLLTDVVMPGMSGRELAENLSLKCPRLKILYMSGYTDGAVAAHGILESGIVILRKPFSRVQLQQSVAEMLAKNPRQGKTEENAEYAKSRE